MYTRISGVTLYTVHLFLAMVRNKLWFEIEFQFAQTNLDDSVVINTSNLFAFVGIVCLSCVAIFA